MAFKYSDEDRKRAIAHPGSSREAGKALGIPHATIHYWRTVWKKAQEAKFKYSDEDRKRAIAYPG